MSAASSSAKRRRSTMSVVDVYDSAAVIGKDFEFLIDQYGVDSVSQLMPKVINILEQLEFLASQNETEGDEIEELKFMIDKLQFEKDKRLNERNKYDQELEQIEESWQTQTRELQKTVENLVDQNEKLKLALRESEKSNQGEQPEKNISAVAELELTAHVAELEARLQQASVDLRSTKRLLRQRTVDAESYKDQLDVLAKENAYLRKRSAIGGAEALRKEKHELEERLSRKETEVGIMEDFLQNEDGVVSQIASPCEELDPLCTFDKRDPDCPRFTTTELKEVMMQRNELRAKLVAVQEELGLLRAKRKQSASHDPSDVFGSSTSSSDGGGGGAADDRPVQGPINREPFDKLHPDSSGIRKFFEMVLHPLRTNSAPDDEVGEDCAARTDINIAQHFPVKPSSRIPHRDLPATAADGVLSRLAAAASPRLAAAKRAAAAPLRPMPNSVV